MVAEYESLFVGMCIYSSKNSNKQDGQNTGLLIQQTIQNYVNWTLSYFLYFYILIIIVLLYWVLGNIYVNQFFFP